MNKQPLVIFDLDDCLLHYSKHYVGWVFSSKYTEIDTHDTNTWFNPKFIYEFNHSEKFIQRDRLPLYYTFRRILSELGNAVVLSSCGEGLEEEVQDALGVTMHEWLHNITCVNTPYDKYKKIEIAHYKFDVLVIDDKKETIDWCKAHGIKAILANQNIDLVNSMIYNHINGETVTQK